MPMGLGGRPYYTAPSGSFGSESSPVGRSIWEQSLPTGYYAYGRSLGVPDDNSAFSNWFSKQFPQFNLGYGAYTAQNPLTANVVDYANSLGGLGEWQRRFGMQDQRIRGLDPGARGGGPARWIGR
jgi:hypothetical protein